MKPAIVIPALLLISPRALCLSRRDFSVDREALGEVVEAFNDFDGEMYAGLMPTNTEMSKWGDSKLMFWLFQPKNSVSAETLTLWFNGGPGCSSFHGGLFEITPVSTAHYPAGYSQTPLQPTLLHNKWAWTKATNIMLVEMPQGVGFSYGPTPESEADIGEDMYGFLSNFFDVFPEMMGKKLFLFGESYAGYYVPSIAHKIHQINMAAGRSEINLAGIGLGNGWIEAETQGPAVIDFAWWHGLIDSTTKDSLHQVWIDCNTRKTMSPPFHDFTVPDECGIMDAVLKAAGKGAFPPSSFRSPNPYDVTTFDLYPVLFGSNTTMDLFYNDPKVKKALNAPDGTIWEGCIPGAGRRGLRQKHEASLPGGVLLAHDQPESVAPYIAELLDSGVDVLIYNGDRDLTTCAQGSEMVLNKMEWLGKEEWPTAVRALWMVNDDVGGYSKEVRGLRYVVVYNSGHLLPNSSPEKALDLITRFTTNQSFQDILLPRFSKPVTKHIIDDEDKDAEWLIPFSKPACQMLFVVSWAFTCFGLGYIAAYKQLSLREQYRELS